jgi:hypothetical protein
LEVKDFNVMTIDDLQFNFLDDESAKQAIESVGTLSDGESWKRAAVILIGVLVLFGVLYASPLTRFDYGQKKEPAPVEQQPITETAKDTERFHYMGLFEGAVHSLYVSALQRPEPKAADTLTKFFVIMETILGPLQAALLALAIRRKFMR